jgi:hypothetical protein
VEQQENDLGIDAADLDRIRLIMSELDQSDLELLDPPAEIWERIDASVASEVRQPPSRVAPSPMVVEYRIDANDILTDVGDGWAEFARENEAAELATPTLDRTLWSYIDRTEIRELWQLLVDRVRNLQREARVPFRCDAPHARRWFEMAIAAEPDGSVRFRSELAFEEPRPPIALLDPETERDPDAEPIRVCSWCGRGEHDGRWLEIEELLRAGRLLERTSMPSISYGICASCRAGMAAELLVPDMAGDTSA